MQSVGPSPMQSAGPSPIQSVGPSPAKVTVSSPAQQAAANVAAVSPAQASVPSQREASSVKASASVSSPGAGIQSAAKEGRKIPVMKMSTLGISIKNPQQHDRLYRVHPYLMMSLKCSNRRKILFLMNGI